MLIDLETSSKLCAGKADFIFSLRFAMKWYTTKPAVTAVTNVSSRAATASFKIFHHYKKRSLKFI
ncbi:hypothetical protein DRO59_01205 [Candidatus Bathyarchaeota archaeon]|nr:MAG: hypothetical protein DRO59_01205 [Candidatus Bathyarchaeota archaeon]